MIKWLDGIVIWITHNSDTAQTYGSWVIWIPFSIILGVGIAAWIIKSESKL